MDKSLYKDVYVFAEQRDGIIQPVALELLGKAKDLAAALGEKVVAIFPGYGIASKAQSLIEAGADRVIVIDEPELREYLTEQYSQVVSQVIAANRPNIVLFGATTIGRDLAPKLSARVSTGLTADCTKLEISPETKDLMMTRPAFGGNLMATIISPDNRPQMSTVRPGVMQKADPQPGRQGIVETFKPQFDASKFRVRMLENVKVNKGAVDISEAKILVSGGRGVGTNDGFEKLNALAQTLGAEVSSSRAMVDAGVIDHNRQVGQTGKTVRPDVYFACGISGAIQHLAGMEESDLIIAINKDKFAPIFKVSDLGIVGDLHKIIPMLTERLKKEMEHK